jgi:hypothetical protein
MIPISKYLRFTGIGLMVIYAIYFVIMGLGKLIGGDSSGISNLLPAAIVGGVAALAWKRPTIAGTLMLGIGMVSAIYYLAIFTNAKIFNILFLAIIPFSAGVILLSAGLIKKPTI